jgi:hypothetical protein
MTSEQLQWIGFGFLAVCLLFLMVAFFVFPQLSRDRRGTVQFISSLCAGFAGTFLTGSAIFQAEWTSTGGKVVVSGTAGCALFMIVFYGYRQLVPAPKIDVDNKISLDIPEHWTFQQVVRALAQSGKAGVEFENFKDAELKAEITNQSLEADSVDKAMLAVRGITITSGAVRKYGVSKDGGTYILKVK